MEFLDPNYKKRHRRLLFTGYFLLAILITGLAGIFVLEANGYYIRRDGEIAQNALLFVDSHPAGAQIIRNGVLESSTTDARLVLPEGMHSFEVTAPGYTSWFKDITLEGGSVAFAKYPFLYPTNPDKTPVTVLTNSAKMSQSPDRRWLLVQPEPNSLEWQLYDLDNDQLAVESLNPIIDDELNDDDELIEPVSVAVLEWSNDNRRMLVQVDYPETTEYWIFDRENTEASIQIVPEEGKELDRLDLVDLKTDQVDLFYADGQLVRYDVESQEVIVLATGVLEYATHGTDLVLYSRFNQPKNAIEVVISQDLNEYVLTTIELADYGEFSLGMSQFDGDWYYYVGSSAAERLRVFQNPLESLAEARTPLPISNKKVRGLRNVEFSQNVRFIAGSHRDGLVVYDAEDAKPYRFDVEGLIDSYKVKWMDGHRMYARINGELIIWEFDNMNYANLGAIADSKYVFFDKNYDAVYTFVDGEEDSRQLMRTALIVEEN